MKALQSLEEEKKQSGNLGKFLQKNKFLFLILAVVFIVFLLWGRSSSAPRVFNYVLGKGSSLEIENDRVNVLLLGIAGGNHDGPNLTDTIMVASYDLKLHKVALISLPRDLWVSQEKSKVNALYAHGLEKGNGLGLARQSIGEILGITIPYAVRVDFNGFVKAVDLVEGIDVDVAKPFDDYVYPIAGKEREMCGYEEKEVELDEGRGKALQLTPGKYWALLDASGKIATASADLKSITYTDEQVIKFFPCRFDHLSFKKGLNHFDGETALKFVRSRHGNNGEGSDFARSRRQQLVLQAFRAKVLSLDTLTDLSKIVDLVKTFGASVETNISQGEYLEFAKMAREVEGTQSFIVDGTGENPLLVTPSAADYGGAWVLVPAGGDYGRIHQFVTASFAASASESATVTKTP